VPYRRDDPKWASNLATFAVAASLADPDIARAYQSRVSMLAPAELFAEPGLPEKITRVNRHPTIVDSLAI
jgi:hypothetical protein